MKKINLVYDKWDNEKNYPYPNFYETLGADSFRDESGFFDFYERYFHARHGYDRNCLPIKRNRIEDVYKNPQENFFYFIKLSINIGDVFIHRNSKFSDEVVKCLRDCKNFNVVFLTEHEGDNEFGFTLLLKIVNELSLNQNQFFILNNNSNLNSYNNKFNSNVNTHRLNLIPLTCNSVFSQMNVEFNPNKIGKFFICHNRQQKPHRYAVLSLLKKNNILDNVNWSLTSGQKRNRNDWNFLDSVLNRDEIDSLKNEIEYFFEIEIKNSDFEDPNWFMMGNGEVNRTDFPELSGSAGESGGLMLPEHSLAHVNSYVNIVNESLFMDNSNVIHISEKSFRPFAFHQIPIIIATQNHIKKMKEEFGFDFFDDIVNHDYDKLPTIRERIMGAMNEIIKLNNNKDFILEFYGKNKERFEKNREIVCKIPDKIDDYNFFKSLMS
jgi:hypothetical protein